MLANRKKVILLTDKFCDLNPSFGVTSGFSNIAGSLQSANIADFRVLHYDDYLITHNQPIDQFLLDSIVSDKPDFMAVSYYPFDDPRNVNLSTFSKIKDMGVPVIFIWFDFGHEQLKNLALRVGTVGSINVVIDTFVENIDKFMPMWVPQDENVFKEGVTKDVDVCFVGSTTGYQTRVDYLNFLKQHINIYISGGQREHRLTIEGYAEVLKKSKISINFPDKPDGIIQAKCRIYESMLCGSLLMEKDNEAIKRWFEPMVHYVPFNSEQDLLRKINYFLNNEQERENIVSNARNKMKNEYSSANWWTKVYNASL